MVASPAASLSTGLAKCGPTARPTLRRNSPSCLLYTSQQRDPAGAFPRGLEGGTNLALNYDPGAYPNTNALLDGSLVLFSQSCPLIAQSDDCLLYTSSIGSTLGVGNRGKKCQAAM